ncbi:FixH family protein [Limimaricola hongkongensis]|uniref:Type cbb3 cytochrome oxidase biogenesis protein CcoH n=1 Tax=Limimaricola hongkongensis DSM 17492 TaxID=1122180 RepID=A0A017HH69_9RHOB|nr:FixH family protein [Limimaricola hongkongensis]EYD73124.1 Type cbb3 cytochrome oxidase biogenesis protein CcoH [Limimaricola hongkongensis DSM 17492]
MTKRELTGRHVLGLFTGAFAVIIGVNLTMATQAVGSFSGLEVDSSYVASQSFERRRAAQERLGWAVQASHADGALRLELRDREGRIVTPAHLAVAIGRPTERARPLSLEAADGQPVALDLTPGLWRIDVEAEAADGTPFEKRITLRVRQ